MSDSGLRTEHTARKRHICDWECGDPIEPGTRYVKAAYPPGIEPNYGPNWVTYRGHGHTLHDCPVYRDRGQAS